ncbi:uncharacterized protein LOC143531447 [Bidens hawaiensis]|uniref:uncharacterized protein LOC143531447 n=1 Tax=Bidens hawaiensis TaxID=980011 RepID=UPI00404B030E
MITSTPIHPQANGQVESSNKIITNNLKKKLGAKKGKWVEEISFVLWANRTTPKNAIGQTSFSMVFGTEAVILAEMVSPTSRSSVQNLETNDQDLVDDLDTINELMDFVKFCIVAYQQRIIKSYNKNARVRRFSW